MAKNTNKNQIVFFGTPRFAVTILEELRAAGITPALVVTAPDKPQGRGLVLTPSPVKVWATQNNIPVFQPDTLKDLSKLEPLTSKNWDLFIVAAYGKIIPENILEIPKYNTLNVHPSLLPKLRGASPIETAILQNMSETGVTIMRLDKEMDHGPIVAQEKINVSPWPITAPELENTLAHAGGKLLAETIPGWIAGSIKEGEQNHAEATYTQKIKKEDAQIDPNNLIYQDYLKICAYSEWPRCFFITEKNGKKMRVVVSKAEYKSDQVTITHVIPEGKNEIPYLDFLRGMK